jgi:manganese-dependent inorganic pyrophosphatase
MRKDKTYVVGHRNPDTDSVCSAIAYAEMRSLTGYSDVIAAVAGDINKQTAFALEYFNTDPPQLLTDITPKVKDYMTSHVVTMPVETPIKKLIETMEKENLRLIPLMNSDGSYKKLVSLFDVTLGFKKLANPLTCLHLHTSIKNLQETLDAESVYLNDSDSYFDGAVLVGAMEREVFSEWLSQSQVQQCIVLTGNRQEIQEAALERKVRCLIVTGGQAIDQEIVTLAKQNGVSLLISPYDTASSLGMVHLSIPAYTLSSPTEQHLTKNHPISEAKTAILNSRNRGMAVVDEEGSIAGIITGADILKSSSVKIIMVDHNEFSQAVTGIDQAEILEIIDHHRLGNTQTSAPIFFINEPVGSTCTIVSRRFFAEGVEITPRIAGLLISGIISDTLFLKSPTATDIDRNVLEKLNQIAKLDLADYAYRLLEAGTNLEGRTANEILTEDFKEYELKESKIGIGQIEVISFDGIYKKKKELEIALQKTREQRNLDFIGLLITDITYSTSQLFFNGTRQLCTRLDYHLLEENVAELRGIVSRKKQLIPHLFNVFT